MTEYRSLLHVAVTALVLIALLPTVAFAGEPGPTHTQAPLTLTDIAGRQVTLNAPVRRMLLGEGRQLYLIASLEPENPLAHVVAWRTDLIAADPATYAQYLEVFPGLAKLPSFKGQEDSLIDIESAIIQKPDLVLLNLEAMQANNDANYVEKLAALNIPVLYIDFRHRPLENTEPTIQLLGRVMGREARAEESSRSAARPWLRLPTSLPPSNRNAPMCSSSGSVATRRIAACLSAQRISVNMSNSPAAIISAAISFPQPSGRSAPNRSSSPTPSTWWLPAPTGRPMCPAATGFRSDQGRILA